MFALEAQNIKKSYGDIQTLQGVSLEIKSGEFFGFLGPNGAGKSTFLKIATTILKPDSGEIWIAGKSIKRQSNEIRKGIGVVFQETTVDIRLTAEENLNFHGQLYGMPDQLITKNSEKFLKMLGLWERRKNFVKNYSGGMSRALELARAFLHEPKIIFLDEPTLGLDPKNRMRILDYLAKMKTDLSTTIFMTTHYLDEAEICDRLAIINEGRIVAEGSPREIETQGNADNLNDAFLNLTGRDIKDEETLKNIQNLKHLYTRGV